MIKKTGTFLLLAGSILLSHVSASANLGIRMGTQPAKAGAVVTQDVKKLKATFTTAQTKYTQALNNLRKLKAGTPAYILARPNVEAFLAGMRKADYAYSKAVFDQGVVSYNKMPEGAPKARARAKLESQKAELAKKLTLMNSKTPALSKNQQVSDNKKQVAKTPAQTTYETAVKQYKIDLAAYNKSKTQVNKTKMQKSLATAKAAKDALAKQKAAAPKVASAPKAEKTAEKATYEKAVKQYNVDVKAYKALLAKPQSGSVKGQVAGALKKVKASQMAVKTAKDALAGQRTTAQQKATAPKSSQGKARGVNTNPSGAPAKGIAKDTSATKIVTNPKPLTAGRFKPFGTSIHAKNKPGAAVPEEEAQGDTPAAEGDEPAKDGDGEKEESATREQDTQTAEGDEPAKEEGDAGKEEPSKKEQGTQTDSAEGDEPAKEEGDGEKEESATREQDTQTAEGDEPAKEEGDAGKEEPSKKEQGTQTAEGDEPAKEEGDAGKEEPSKKEQGTQTDSAEGDEPAKDGDGEKEEGESKSKGATTEGDNASSEGGEEATSEEDGGLLGKFRSTLGSFYKPAMGIVNCPREAVVKTAENEDGTVSGAVRLYGQCMSTVSGLMNGKSITDAYALTDEQKESLKTLGKKKTTQEAIQSQSTEEILKNMSDQQKKDLTKELCTKEACKCEILGFNLDPVK